MILGTWEMGNLVRMCTDLEEEGRCKRQGGNVGVEEWRRQCIPERAKGINDRRTPGPRHRNSVTINVRSGE